MDSYDIEDTINNIFYSSGSTMGWTDYDMNTDDMDSDEIMNYFGMMNEDDSFGY